MRTIKTIIILLLLEILTSCAIASKAGSSRRYIQDKWEREAIFRAEYPHLETLLDEGLVRIYSVVEIIPPDGHKKYIVKYLFITKNLNYGEKMAVLKENFPEIYQLYCNGIVSIDNLYEYVDKDENIKYHITYHYVTNSTYNYF